ncbi:MAG: hypothetical protein KKI15_09640 [Proteobacteria bacterium]|nr:hypothetical protein [Pseudomonadota bacterium]
MKIADSSIQFYSERTALEKHQKQESLTVWGPGEERSTTTSENGQGQKIDVQKQIASLQESVKVSLSDQAIRSRSVKAVAEPGSEEKELMADLNIRILKAMIERLTGKRIKIHYPDAVQAQKTGQENAAAGIQEIQKGNEGADSESPSEGGLIYDSYESHYEYESTSFDASGKIMTEDGQEIDFSVALNMSREFFSEEQISIRAGDALKDPLVINFSGQAAELSETKFSFDIDNDGIANQISTLKSGSGFLALDKNGDNRINNGSEFFGPESGNGFQDLAAYDLDGNNWIDENDSIYDKLRIWTKDEAGNDTLFALGEKGIGAIYLDSAASLFSLKDSQNSLLGQVQSTGIFLNENGLAGTIQQIDLVA